MKPFLISVLSIDNFTQVVVNLSDEEENLLKKIAALVDKARHWSEPRLAIREYDGNIDLKGYAFVNSVENVVFDDDVVKPTKE